MIFTIEYCGENAGDLGFLLHKNPTKVQRFENSIGVAHVFYPVNEATRCKAALLLEIDSLDLAKSGRFKERSGADSLSHYVNDRPYASGSVMAQTISQVFRSALNGVSKEAPELAKRKIPLVISLAAIPTKGHPELLEEFLDPLGIDYEVEQVQLNQDRPGWGMAPYVNLTIRAEQKLGLLLRQVCVVLAALDDTKHYWVGADEVEKLLRLGEGWLEEHPKRELIAKRFLARQQDLTALAMQGLRASSRGAGDPQADSDPTGASYEPEGPSGPPKRESLATIRTRAVLDALEATGASTVGDVGCGEGRLLQQLVGRVELTRIIGSDVSAQALARAAGKIYYDELGDLQRQRISLIHSSVSYEDSRLEGLDAIVMMEVIEHIEPERLGTVEWNIFKAANPRAVIVTTPNVEYNRLFPTLEHGEHRHHDHRFEWTRSEFERWGQKVANEYGYRVSFSGIGALDENSGTPSQMAVFERTSV